MKSGRRWIREIAGKDVIVQSCWVDDDLDIIAHNVAICKNGRQLCCHNIQISPDGNISYPYFTPYPQHGEKMTDAEYDNFLKVNFQEVLNLIMSLLEPNELALLRHL